jgi:LytS/YehU family sensor histidine kinase
MVARLGDFLRHSLESDPTLVITLEQEVEALMLYLEIEKIRFGDRLDLAFEVDGRAAQAMVPSLLLQPLVENSIKHAIGVNEEGGTISLDAEVVEDELRLVLSDTGAGAHEKPTSPEGSRRVGLENTLQRLKTLYNEAYVFDIQKRAHSGLQITICIPYRTE